MIVKVKNNYQIPLDREYIGEFDINLEEYCGTDKIEYIETLEDYIRDYIYWEHSYFFFNPDDNDIIEDSSNKIVLNMQEIVDFYSYLVVPPKEMSCCEKASNHEDNFCPTCGKKIIY